MLAYSRPRPVADADVAAMRSDRVPRRGHQQGSAANVRPATDPRGTIPMEKLETSARREKGLFHHRSDLPRGFYLHLREAMDLRRSIPRRLAARESASRATLKIPRSLGLAVFPPSRF